MHLTFFMTIITRKRRVHHTKRQFVLLMMTVLFTFPVVCFVICYFHQCGAKIAIMKRHRKRLKPNIKRTKIEEKQQTARCNCVQVHAYIYFVSCESQLMAGEIFALWKLVPALNKGNIYFRPLDSKPRIFGELRSLYVINRSSTHQSQKDTANLNDIGIRHRVKSTNKRVERGDARWHNDRGNTIKVKNNAGGGHPAKQEWTLTSIYRRTMQGCTNSPPMRRPYFSWNGSSKV